MISAFPDQNAIQPHLILSGITQRFGSHTALDDVALTVRQGEFVTLLGPSGSGKTTLLRAIAGLTPPTAGRIQQGNDDVTFLPVERRDIGIVFQSYALFPTMNVADNITYGLRGWSRQERRERLAELLAMIGLAAHAGKYPSQLSGGQQQRVALARALAPRPGLLLLDEPLSALDAEVRRDLRGELRRLQRQLGITTLMVTHDQEEALTLSDRIMVLNRGRVEQVGTPVDLYERPQTLFVAGFIGAMNQLPLVRLSDGRLRLGPWTLEDTSLGAGVTGVDLVLCVRPEWLSVTDGPPPEQAHIAGGYLNLPARLVDSEYRGAQTMVQFTPLADELAGITLTGLLTTKAGIPAGAQGQPVGLRLPLAAMHCFARDMVA